jgi:hypothetical protein
MFVPARLLGFRARRRGRSNANGLSMSLLWLTVTRPVPVAPVTFGLAVSRARWRAGEDAEILGVCGSSRRGP